MTLYETIRHAVRHLFADMEETLSALSFVPASDDRFFSMMQQLEKTGTLIRQEATAFLTSDAAASFSEDAVYNAKRHIHTDIGHVLVKTRLFLQRTDPSIEGESLLAEWQEVFCSLQSGTWKACEADAKKQITDAGNAAGIRVVFSEDPPAEEEALRAYIKGATAKILAAVRAGEKSVTLANK